MVIETTDKFMALVKTSNLKPRPLFCCTVYDRRFKANGKNSRPSWKFVASRSCIGTDGLKCILIYGSKSTVAYITLLCTNCVTKDCIWVFDQSIRSIFLWTKNISWKLMWCVIKQMSNKCCSCYFVVHGHCNTTKKAKHLLSTTYVIRFF